MLRKRSVLFTALMLLSLILAPAGHASAHTDPKGVVESARNGKGAYRFQAATNNYEPDNTAGQAKPITSGSPQTRSIVPNT
jgi:hypothetical protein